MVVSLLSGASFPVIAIRRRAMASVVVIRTMLLTPSRAVVVLSTADFARLFRAAASASASALAGSLLGGISSCF